MKHDSPAQQQKLTTGISDCHQISESNECSHCITLNTNQCQHAMGDDCASSCGHSVVTAAFLEQIFDLPVYIQDTQILSEQFTISIVLDPDLRPPQ